MFLYGKNYLTLFIISPTFVGVHHFKDLCDFTSRFQQTSVCCGAAKCLSVSHGLLCPLVAGSATRNAELSNALNDLVSVFKTHQEILHYLCVVLWKNRNHYIKPHMVLNSSIYQQLLLVVRVTFFFFFLNQKYKISTRYVLVKLLELKAFLSALKLFLIQCHIFSSQRITRGAVN